MLVHTDQLTKRYGDFSALDACSMTVREGDIFGLLGPNGAGKTTLLRLLLGFIQPTSGASCVAGFDCVHQSLEVRSRTAYLPGEARLFRRMNGHQVLDFFASPIGSKQSKNIPFSHSQRAGIQSEKASVTLRELIDVNEHGEPAGVEVMRGNSSQPARSR